MTCLDDTSPEWNYSLGQPISDHPEHGRAETDRDSLAAGIPLPSRLWVIIDDEPMSDKDDHAAWVTRLVDAANSGTIVDLRSGVPAHLYDPATADQWSADRHIPARAIRDVLSDNHTGLDPFGLRIIGARITGDVDFAHLTFDHPLHLIRCRIDRPMNLDNVRLRQLVLTGSRLRSLSLDGITITNGLFAERITTDGEVRAIGATVSGQLVLNDARLYNPAHRALTLERASLTGGLFAARISTHGKIVANGISISGQLNLASAHLHNPHSECLTLERASITGGLSAARITVDGTIRAVGATVGGQINLANAHLHNPHSECLILDGATVAGGLFGNHITAHGEISALDATINGPFSLNDAHLHNPEHHALTLNRGTVAGGFFGNHITAHGEISALDATINGSLGLNDAHLHNPEHHVLTLDGATVTGDIVAMRISADGTIRAVDAVLGGQLVLVGAHLHNPQHNVLALDGATVTGVVVATDDAHLGAVSVFHADGLISARRTRFKNHLDLRDAKPRPTGTGHLVIDLGGATLRELTLPAEGPAVANLSRTKITHLNTPADREPQYPVVATGWEIGDAEGRIRTDHVAATRWLTRAHGRDFSPHPWHALAAVYERNGHPAEARRLRVTAANKVTKAAPPATKVQRWAYRIVAGHGYYPFRAALWLIMTLVCGFVLVEASRGHFVPTNPSAATAVIAVASDTIGGGDGSQVEWEQSRTITGADDCATHPQYPCLDSFSYALTGVIPAATGVVRPDWTVSAEAPWWVKVGIPALRVIAWIFTAILLAGVTGLLRKSS
ncbi:hypothetical protein KUG88_29210 [Rhodococcus rhodochrous]|uniref:hypothetical protein n=1 Tax=Rhodococcus rhodochrous TaxID=1829 RepID=UPI001E60622D|nr:hypothetical protein [Rhodococcus rhodochrous]MCB8914172.1 hypothetical protein [Rhodococcus rhodochrous]